VETPPKNQKSQNLGNKQKSHDRKAIASDYDEFDSDSDVKPPGRRKRQKLNVQVEESHLEAAPMRRKLPGKVRTEDPTQEWKKYMPKVEWRNNVWVGEGPAPKKPPRVFGKVPSAKKTPPTFAKPRSIRREAIKVKKEAIDSDDENGTVVTSRSPSRSVRAASAASSRLSVQKNVTHKDTDSDVKPPGSRKRRKLNVQVEESHVEEAPMRRKVPVKVRTEEQKQEWQNNVPNVERRNDVWVGEAKKPARTFAKPRSIRREAIKVKKEAIDSHDENGSVVASRSPSRSVRAASAASSRLSVQKNLRDILKSAKGTARRF
jgi:hypothetical protein